MQNGAAVYYLRSSVLGGQVVAELDASGGWFRGYVYLGGQLVAVQQGGVTWVHQDSVTKGERITDGSGTVVSTIELDPFGGDTSRSFNASFQSHHFTTYERDTVGGMDEAMARRYHGWWSRFSEPDPYDGSYSLADPQSFNRYSYVQSDPVNFVDPTGLRPIICDFVLGDPTGWQCEQLEPWDKWEGFDPKEGGGGTKKPADKGKLDPTNPVCIALAKKIENLRDEILHRADDILRNPQRLPETVPGARKFSVQGHKEILNEQVSIWQRRVNDYKDKCGGGPGSPPPGVPVGPPIVTPRPGSNRGPRMVPVPPPALPTFMSIPFIMMDPCLVYPVLCSRPRA